MRILNVANEKDKKILRTPPKEVNFDNEDSQELRQLVKDMEKAMHEANGIGLAANQVGVDKRMFLAQIEEGKLYAIFNPRITKKWDELVEIEEGCLSVPGTFGNVERHKKIKIEGQDWRGKKIKMKAWGLLAVVFQHEVDHLDGKLFIDKATGLHEVKKKDQDHRR